MKVFLFCMLCLSHLAFANPDDANVNKQIRQKILDYYFKTEKINEAIDYLKDEIKNDPLDADAWYWLGIIHERLQNKDEAKQSFKASKKIEDDLFIEQSRKTLLADLGSGFRSRVKLIGGYDSNVLLITDSVASTGTNKTTWFIKPSALVQQPFGKSGFMIEGAASYTKNFSKATQIYDHIIASLALDYRWKTRLGLKYGLANYISTDYIWYNLQGMKIFSYADTIGMRAVPWRGKNWSITLDLPFSYVWYPSPQNTDPTYNLEGLVLNPYFAIRHNHGYWTYKEILRWGKQTAKGSNVSAEFYGGDFGIQREFRSWRLILEGNLYVLKTIYPNSIPHRGDLMVSGDLNLKKGLGEHGPNLLLSAAYLRNDSTLNLAKFRKYVFLLGVSHEIF